MRRLAIVLAALLPAFMVQPARGQIARGDRFDAIDVFQLEWVSDPQISPDGRRIVYVRHGYDVRSDRPSSVLWIINADGTGARPLTTGEQRARSPRWSPDGTRLAFVAQAEESSEIFVRWMDGGQDARVTRVTDSPGGLSWSPDGARIAFTMFVPGSAPASFAQMPAMPDGADWGPAIRVIERLQYRADGQGFTRHGNTHVFVVPAEGGTPRQLTEGAFDHGGPPSWTPDGQYLVLSANRYTDSEQQPLNSEVHAVAVADGAITTLTSRYGPDDSPVVSPDGRLIAYTGFDDTHQGYRVQRLYVMNRDGSGSRLVSGNLDRDAENPRWDAQGRGLYIQYNDQGNTKIAHVDLNGILRDLASDVGGLSLGRPYSGGQYSVANDGTFAFTHTRPDHPADLAVGRSGSESRRLTRVNDDLFAQKKLGEVEEIWWQSSHDRRRVQGWILKPPGFDPARRYPLVLEIHGGPFADYGVRFAAELQLYAAAGYVVFYANPRGSTGYGEEFGNLIHHAYPSHDYDDLMSGVDAVLAQGYVDPEQLFVTGGSGGGVLSAWIVGHTNRFRAAAVQKPVINWYSFVLTADATPFFWKYWFPGPPWEHERHYLERSPIAYVGNVTTPTMLITGEQDYRTPMSESEQFYTALRIRGIESALVRVPDASHGIADRPSNLIAKVQHILGWFEKYRART